MKYSIEEEEKYCIIKLNEEKVDSSVAPALKSQLITMNAAGISNVIIDLSDVKYIDSSGLSALLVGNRMLNEDLGIFVVSNPGEHVVKLMKISQLDKVLNILPTMGESIERVFMHEIERELRTGADEEEN